MVLLVCDMSNSTESAMCDVNSSPESCQLVPLSVVHMCDSYVPDITCPPKNGVFALQTPRTEFWRVGSYGYSTNRSAKM